MKKSLSISIGIPAYNEASNLKRMIPALLNQDQTGWNLEKIMVLSDNSTDDSEMILQSFKNRKIDMLKGRTRRGKSDRVNQFFKLIESDIAVVLDADTQLYSRTSITDLIKPMIESENVLLSSGATHPADPVSLVEKVIVHGEAMWEAMRKKAKNSEVYYCTGKNRAFRKQLYKEIHMPAASAEGVYPYLYCQKKGYQFKRVRKTILTYRSPATLKDYVKQMRRFLTTKQTQSEHFGEEFTHRYFTISRADKAGVIVEFLFRHPIATMAYLSCMALPKILHSIDMVRNEHPKGVWEIATTTKI